MIKTVGAAEFKAKCLNIIERMDEDPSPVVITKRGKPVAILSPIGKAVERRSIVGAMKGSVTGFDDAFSPVLGADAWDASR